MKCCGVKKEAVKPSWYLYTHFNGGSGAESRLHMPFDEMFKYEMPGSPVTDPLCQIEDQKKQLKYSSHVWMETQDWRRAKGDFQERCRGLSCSQQWRSSLSVVHLDPTTNTRDAVTERQAGGLHV